MLRSGLFAAGLMAVMLPVPAFAQSGTGGCTSDGTRGMCWVAATDPGRSGGTADPSQAGSGKPAGDRPAGQPRFPCIEQPWTPPPAGDPLWGGHSPSQGSLKLMICRGGGALQGWPRVVFAPNGQPVAVPQVSPADLAEQAISTMNLSAPDIRLAPPADFPTRRNDRLPGLDVDFPRRSHNRSSHPDRGSRLDHRHGHRNAGRDRLVDGRWHDGPLRRPGRRLHRRPVRSAVTKLRTRLPPPHRVG
jgi:hypothetical protein